MEPADIDNNGEPMGERELPPDGARMPERKRTEYPEIKALDFVQQDPQRCDACGGNGVIKVPSQLQDSRKLDRMKCPGCNGTGKTPPIRILIAKCDAPWERVDLRLSEENWDELRTIVAGESADLHAPDLHEELARLTGGPTA